MPSLIDGSPVRPDARSGPGRKRVVLATFGSLGDLHPYIGVALGLIERGYDAAIATSAAYREKIEALGIGFHPVRPDHPDWRADPELMRRVMDMRTGSEHIIREMFMPILRESYADTLAAAAGADLLVTHPLTFTAPLAAEKLGVPWVSTMLAPLGFFSAYDPPVLPPAQWLKHLRPLGPVLWKPFMWLLKWWVRRWSEPYRKLRVEIGLPHAADPLFEGQHSPFGVLALFSQFLASKQPDWPAETRICGFPFFDRHGEAGMPSELSAFLEAGPPPVVFTLGSSAVLDAGPFYEYSAAAARKIGRRAVLLVGEDPRNRPHSIPEGVLACEYAPFSELFRRAAAIVHQGGVGTTGQAMLSGKPMLVMPYAHDQPDNADRVVRLGIARHISRQAYRPGRVAAELERLLGEPRYAERAAEVGRQVARENGVGAACEALDRVLAQGRRIPEFARARA